MKKVIYIPVLLTLLAFTSCKRKFENPEPKSPPANTGSITIDSIIKKYVAHYTSIVPATELFKFPDDVNLTCLVTADEVSGNIYKSVFVEDATGSLQVKLINAGGLAVGDQIRINLKNVILNDYGGLVQLDSVDIEKRVVKLSSGNVVTPTKMTFNQLETNAPGGLKKYQSKLVLLDSVEFVAGDKGKLFADPVNKFTLERIIQNPYNQTMIVRTSGYANFAGYTIPCGKGSLVAIVGEYNGTLQLTIRNFTEVKLEAGGCPLLVQAFDAGIQPWTNYNVSGSINWVGGTYNNETFGKISNFVSGNQACETWLISPPVDISNSPNPSVSFRSAYNYSGPAIEFLVSTNYISGNPTLATWTSLSPNLPSSAGYIWAASGKLPLGSYKSANTRFAFKYTGTSSSGSTWEVDDVAVFAE